MVSDAFDKDYEEIKHPLPVFAKVNKPIDASIYL